jgi:cell wall-associated NlpC family hydrolase
VTDPLSDPRAADLLAAVPADVSTLASAFQTAAQEATMTATGLTAARDDGTWTGHAADSFRDSIGRVPAELERIRIGYAAVATALSDYETSLALLQTDFVKVVGQLNDLGTQIGAARTAATNTRNVLSTPGPHMSFNDLREAELAVALARRTLDGYHAEAQQLRSRAFTLLEEFDSARSLCRATAEVAQRTAPVQPQAGQGKHVTGPHSTLTGVTGAVFGMGPVAGAGGAGSGAPTGEERRRIEAMIRQADGLLGTPYVYGGGHSAGAAASGGLDCSGFVSAVLRSGGFINGPVTTEGFAGQPGIASGAGRYVTIYDRTGCGPNEHVIVNINGRFYESGGGSASGGAPFVHEFTPSSSYLASFNTVLHPAGL